MEKSLLIIILILFANFIVYSEEADFQFGGTSAGVLVTGKYEVTSHSPAGIWKEN